MRSINGNRFTDEQNAIVNFALTGNDLLVNALAGASKSTTSGQICKELKAKGKKVLYTTFGSRNIRDFNSSYGDYAFVKSNYGLAHVKIGSAYRNAGRLFDIFPIDSIINLCKLEKIEVNGYEFDKFHQAYDILRMITNFCYSVDYQVGEHHAQSEFLIGDNKEATRYYYNHLLPYASNVWDEMVDPRSSFPITHDVYMKVWASGLWNDGKLPILNFDTIILDERQDSNPPFINVINNQSVQKLVVGDKLQQLYEWRGCVDAMNMLNIKTTLPLSKSFRFGEEIAHLSSDIIYHHTGEDIDMKGFEKIKTRVHLEPVTFKNSTVLCRTNGACVTHLVKNHLEKRSVKFVGDISKTIKNIKGILALRSKRKAFGALAVFKSYKELHDYSQTSAGGEIKTLISVMNTCKKNKIDANQLIDILDKSAKLKSADVTVSTVHKAKGLEFDNVIIGNDFRSKDDEDYEHQDTNLLYVAVTRAKKNLDISHCSELMSIVGCN